MSAPRPKRGEVWQIDFGLAAKIRPALVLGCDIAEQDRMLVTVVYHTTAVRNSRWEVRLSVRGLQPGAFDTQNIYTIPVIKLMSKRAVLSGAQLHQVEDRVRVWLGL